MPDLWYKDAIIYSLNLETFMDASGDGIGDFEEISTAIDRTPSDSISPRLRPLT